MKNSYTLIEILVAVTIFTIVIAAPTGFFVGSLKGQIKSLASQKLLDNTSYTLEYISRALRMAKKELNCSDINDPATCSCLKSEGYGFNYENPAGNPSAVRFINHKGECQEFFLGEGRLKESKAGLENYLTSEELELISLKFNLFGQGQDDTDQPRVTLSLDIKGAKGQMPELRPEIKIQTTISQRNLDVPY
jgi:type II secretory pathway pseudopilin PulG